MYAGAIFIQQSLHLDLYLAIVGLLAITALYTVAGIMGPAWCSELMGRDVGRPFCSGTPSGVLVC